MIRMADRMGNSRVIVYDQESDTRRMIPARVWMDKRNDRTPQTDGTHSWLYCIEFTPCPSHTTMHHRAVELATLFWIGRTKIPFTTDDMLAHVEQYSDEKYHHSLEQLKHIHYERITKNKLFDDNRDDILTAVHRVQRGLNRDEQRTFNFNEEVEKILQTLYEEYTFVDIKEPDCL